MKKIFIALFFTFLGINAYAQSQINDKGFLYRSSTNYMVYSEDGVLFFKYDYDSPYNTLVKYPQSKYATSYTIPEWVRTIERGAFQGNQHLEYIRIPSTVNYIGENAFADCSALKSIEVYVPSTAARALENDESHSQVNEVGRYNIQGVKFEEGKDGQVQIILYSDGTAKKVIE